MAEKKAGLAAPPLRVPAQQVDAFVDNEDMTVLFSPPRELLEQSAAREENELTVVQRGSSWESEDEATPAGRASSSAQKPKSEPVTVRPAPEAAAFAAPVVAVSRPAAAAPALSADLSDADIGAIVGPRRNAQRLAIGVALALVVIFVVVARFAP